MKDRDREAAVYYWKLSAAQGYAGAEYHLGLVHYHGGGGLERDLAEARRLLELAAAKGLEGAKHNLAIINAQT